MQCTNMHSLSFFEEKQLKERLALTDTRLHGRPRLLITLQRTEERERETFNFTAANFILLLLGERERGKRADVFSSPLFSMAKDSL